MSSILDVDRSTMRGAPRMVVVRPHAALWPARLYVLALALLVFISGCGGCGSGDDRGSTQLWGGMGKEAFLKMKEEQRAKEQADAAAAQKKAEEEAAQRQAQEEAERQAMLRAQATHAAAAAAATGAPAPPQVVDMPTPEAPPVIDNSQLYPPLPAPIADYSHWDVHALLVSRVTNNPELLTALRERQKHPLGTAEEVADIRALLSRDAVGRLRQDGMWKLSERSADSLPAAAVLAAALPVLTANGRPEGLQTIEAVLSGSLPTEDPRAAIDAAFAALAAYPSNDGDELFVRALISPDALRPTPEARALLFEMRGAAMQRAKQYAGGNLRILLARAMVDPTTPADLQPLFRDVLLDGNPANVDAYLTLMSKPLPASEMRNEMLRRMAEASSNLLGYLLGLPERQMTQVGDGWPRLVADRLWNEQFATMVSDRMVEARNLNDAAPLLTLAATLPTPRARYAIYHTLERHWEDGPPAVEQPWSGVAADPALPLVLKAFQRHVVHVATRPAQAGSGASLKSDAYKEREAWAAHKRATADQWAKTIERILRRQCGVLYRISMSKLRAAPASATVAPPPDLPLELHDRQQLRASYTLRWPPAGRERISDAGGATLRIEYARLEGKISLTRVLSNYRRQLELATDRGSDQGGWLDSYEEVRVPNGDRSAGRLARSIDVFVTRAKPDQPAPPDEDQELTVEILFVESEDPSTEPAVLPPRALQADTR